MKDGHLAVKLLLERVPHDEHRLDKLLRCVSGQFDGVCLLSGVLCVLKLRVCLLASLHV